MNVTWSEVAPTVTAVLVVALGYATQLLLEKGRRRAAAVEQLQDLRRIECVRMLTSSERVVQIELPPGVDERAKADLADADSTLQLLGPSALTDAARTLATSARATASFGSWDEYRAVRRGFIEVAKEVLDVTEGEATRTGQL